MPNSPRHLTKDNPLTPPYPKPKPLLPPLARLGSGLIPFATANLLPACPTTPRPSLRRAVTMNIAKPKRTSSSSLTCPDLSLAPPHTCRHIAYCRRSPLRPKVCGTEVVLGCVGQRLGPP
jgi:hypothetical protein